MVGTTLFTRSKLADWPLLTMLSLKQPFVGRIEGLILKKESIMLHSWGGSNSILVNLAKYSPRPSNESGPKIWNCSFNDSWITRSPWTLTARKGKNKKDQSTRFQVWSIAVWRNQLISFVFLWIHAALNRYLKRLQRQVCIRIHEGDVESAKEGKRCLKFEK